MLLLTSQSLQYQYGQDLGKYGYLDLLAGSLVVGSRLLDGGQISISGISVRIALRMFPFLLRGLWPRLLLGGVSVSSSSSLVNREW